MTEKPWRDLITQILMMQSGAPTAAYGDTFNYANPASAPAAQANEILADVPVPRADPRQSYRDAQRRYQEIDEYNKITGTGRR